MGNLTIEKLNKWAKGSTFVETGSCEGWTIPVALEHGFKKIHGIELNPELYNFSLNLSGPLFDSNGNNIGNAPLKDHPNVKLWLGDTVELMDEICETLDEQTTFWLDAHESGPTMPRGKYGPCPLLQELKSIKKSPRNDHVIMIDDVRILDTWEWNFITKESVIKLIYEINKDYIITYIDGTDPDCEYGYLPNDILVAHLEN